MNAEINLQYGKELFRTFQECNDDYSNARARITSDIGLVFSTFRKTIGEMQFEEVTPNVTHLTRALAVDYYQSMLLNLVDGEEVLIQLNELVKIFFDTFWNLQQDPVVASLFKLGTQMLYKLNELKFQRQYMANRLDNLADSYRDYDVDLAMWLARTNN